MDKITELAEMVYKSCRNEDLVPFVKDLNREMANSAFTIRLFEYLGAYLKDTRDSTEGRSNDITEILPQRGDLVTTVCKTLEYDQNDIMNFIEAFNEKIADQSFTLELYQHFAKTINILPNFPL